MQRSTEQGHGQIPATRRDEILKLAKQSRVVKVTELAELLGVAEMTIRRDLEIMEQKGLVERTHGGAILSDRVGLELLFHQKSGQRQAEKAAIGRLAATLVEEGDTVFVNSGSTTIQFMKSLDRPGVRIVTNNPLAAVSSISEKVELHLTGGELRRESLTLVGEEAMRAIRQVYANKCVIGSDGFSIRHGLTNAIQAEAWLNRLMVRKTHGEVILAADSSKVGKVANFLMASITAVSTIVTDDRIDPQYVEEFERLGIRVLRASLTQAHLTNPGT